MTDKLKDKLLKIKALADRGSDGERENAKNTLKRLLDKYDLTFEELIEFEDNEETSLHTFRAREWYYRQLLVNIVYKVLDDNGVLEEDIHVYEMKHHRRVYGVYCTEAQAIEISLEFEYRKQELDNMLENFVLAFIFKNGIESGKKRQAKELTPEELAKYYEINKFETMINPTSRHTLKLEEYKGDSDE